MDKRKEKRKESKEKATETWIVKLEKTRENK